MNAISQTVRRMIGRFNYRDPMGNPICPHCGSTHVIIRVFEGSNRRHSCFDCGVTSRIYGD